MMKYEFLLKCKWQSPIMVQKWWNTMKVNNMTLHHKTIKRLHANLICPGSVVQKKVVCQPKTVITKMAKATASEATHKSPKKFIRQYK